jgi:peptidyl-prolyl cis-trans isomerase A (cyclophilin A)
MTIPLSKSVVARTFAVIAMLTTGLGCASAAAGDPMETAILSPRIVYEPGVVPDSFIVRLATTQGDVDLIFRKHWAPIGVAQFYEAVSTGVYDGARFFRALRGFVVQFGIAADPAVTAAWLPRQIADDPVTESNNRGSVVFATGGPNTRTVQLFINLRANARLDAMGFAPIGEVIRGMDAVDAIYTGYGDGGAPGSSPDQGRITSEGEAYLAAAFPRLDKINTARVIQAWLPPR